MSSIFSSHSLVHKTDLAISALDISPYRTHAVLAGRDILKTVRIEGATCSEDFNLRSTIIAYASTHNLSRGGVSAQHKDQLAANDVKWSHGKFDTTIATAAANGRIVLYDINRAGVELARLHEHTRQVHKICFNPHQGALLLSGSQDATIRMWDLRGLAGERSVMTCRSTHRFIGNNEGIRDVRWSPSDGVEFASGTDNGVIQRWDFRKENAPVLKINAHDKTCHSVDWHPSGRYLASAGADKNVKVWDFKSTDRRMKPSWQLRAPQAVLSARWRPVGGSSEASNSGDQQCTYLATSYNQRDPRIHIWDFRRPHVPYKEVDRYESPATGMLWCSEDLLWSVGVAGIFTQTDLKFVPKPIERRNINVLATAPNGQLCFFSKFRAGRPRSFVNTSTAMLQHSETGGRSGERFISSRSGIDGTLEEASILNSSLRKRRQKSLSVRALGSTPPLTGASTTAPAQLDEALRSEEGLHNDQVAACGYVLGVFDFDAFKYLARCYQQPLSTAALHKDLDLHEIIPSMFQKNATLAAYTGQYRLAQSWRILGSVIRKELVLRVEAAKQHCKSCSVLAKSSNISIATKSERDFNDSLHVGKLKKRSPATSIFDSTSNMPTPLAKPVEDLPNISTTTERDLVLNELKANKILRLDGEQNPATATQTFTVQQQQPTNGSVSLGLPSDTFAKQEPSDNGSFAAISATVFGSFTDIDYQMRERRAAINNYRARPRPILRLDEPAGLSRNLSVMPLLDRHDSDESFQMLSSSTDSGPRSMSLAGSFGDSYNSNPSDSTLEKGNGGSTGLTIHAQSTKSYESPRDYSYSGVDVPIDDAGYDSRTSEMATDFAGEFHPIRRPSDPKPSKVHFSALKSSKKNEARDISKVDECFMPANCECLVKTTFPWSATALLPPMLDYHLNNLSDTQLPTFLALYLRYLFPSSFDRNVVITSILSYHQQLVSLGLFEEAAALRNNCYPIYSEIWERGVADNQAAGWYCMTCLKAVKGHTVGVCKRCKQEWGVCPICEASDSPLPRPDSITTSKDFLKRATDQCIGGTRLWAWCQECGHGGHSACLSAWWADIVGSEGACPYQGCLHDCMPGIRRDKKMKDIAAEAKKAKLRAGGVLKDAWVVGDSKAVERTRGMIASDGNAAEVAAVTRTSSGKVSALFAGSSLGGKKVRLVEPVEAAGTAGGAHAHGQLVEDEPSVSTR